MTAPGRPVDDEIPVEREHVQGSFPFRDPDERSVAKIHWDVLVLLHKRPNARHVSIGQLGDEASRMKHV